MHRAGSGDPAPARQGRCGRTLFQYSIEHCVRPAWHGKPLGQDHDWSRGGLHVDRTHARLANAFRLPIRVAIRNRAGSNPDSVAGAATFTRSTRSFTRGESVGA